MGSSVQIPAAAAAAGMERLTFADDFDTPSTVDARNERTDGFLWYVDRAYKQPPLLPDELEWHAEDSYLRILTKGSMGITSYSSTARTGFMMKEGYIEGRIRLGAPQNEKVSHPLFYMLGDRDFLGKPWADNGLIGVLAAPRTRNKQGEMKPYYVGNVHHYQRSWERDKDGKPIIRLASNLVNAGGYNDWFTFLDDEWHTYGLLWEKGHIAWYMDGREMHAVRFGKNELPRHYYRNQPHPVQPLESKDLSFANRTWLGAYTVFDNESMVISLYSRAEWPMDVDWIRVWQK